MEDKVTIDYYNRNYEVFSESTINVDFEYQQNKFLKYLASGSSILDLGCGAGRDSKAFLNKGFKVTAIDGSLELCKVASKYIGQEIICKSFDELDYKEEFEGVWACASLLHVKYKDLEDIINKISRALKHNGYLYMSFKYGEFEGYKNDRYFTYLTEERLDNLLKGNNDLSIVETYISTDVRVGRENEKWINVILKKK